MAVASEGAATYPLWYCTKGVNIQPCVGKCMYRSSYMPARDTERSSQRGREY